MYILHGLDEFVVSLNYLKEVGKHLLLVLPNWNSMFRRGGNENIVFRFC